MIPIPAKPAGIGWALTVPMMLRDLLAGRAVNPARVEFPDQVVQAGRIIGELPLELHEQGPEIRTR